MSLIIKGTGIKSVRQTVDTDTDLGDYRVKSLGQNSSFRFTFGIPGQAISIQKIALIVSPVATVANVDIDLSSDFALDSEAININSASDTTSLYSFTINEFSEIDLTALFPGVQGGHNCGIFVDHNAIGTTLNYFETLVRYI